MRKTNKSQLVKAHLLAKGSITSWEAIQDYGATRLSAIIFNLRKAGMNIVTQNIAFTDVYGNEGTYAKYIYVRLPRGAGYVYENGGNYAGTRC